MKFFILAAICLLALIPITIHADQTDTNCAVRHAFDHDGNVIGKFEYPCVTGGGCSDCTPPTIGKSYDQLQYWIEDGFTLNYKPTSVEYRFGQLSETINLNQTNVVMLKIYENGGPDNLANAEVAFGCSPDDWVSVCPMRVEWNRDHEGTVTTKTVGNITLHNTYDLAKSCDGYPGNQCTFLFFMFEIHEKPEGGKVMVQTFDHDKNSWHFVIDGIEIQ